MESPRSLIIRFNEMEWHAKGVNKKCSHKKIGDENTKLRVDGVGLLWRLSAKLWWQFFQTKYHKLSNFLGSHNCPVSCSHPRWHFAQSPPTEQQKSRVIKFFSYSSLQFVDNWLESHSSRTVRTNDTKKSWKLLKVHAMNAPPRRNSRHDFIFKLVSDWNMLHIIKIVFAATRLEFLYFGNFMTVRR